MSKRVPQFNELKQKAESIIWNDPEKALQLLNEAIQTPWPSWGVWHNHGLTLHLLKQYEVAITSYHRSIELNGDESWIDTCESLKFCYNEAGTQEDGWRYFDALSETNPYWWIVWHERGYMAWKTKRLDEAILSYGRSIELHPDPIWIYSAEDLRICIDQCGEHEKGRNYFSELVQKLPDYWILWHDKAWIDRKCGRIDDAIFSYQEAIRLHGEGWFWSWQDLADLYSKDIGDFSKAVGVYTKAIERGMAEKNDNMGWAWYGKANALRRLGNYDNAIEFFQKALELNVKDVSWCWFELGELYQEKPHPSLVKAFECYLQTLKLEPSYEDAKKAIVSLISSNFTATIRDLVTAAFDDDSLTILCYDHFRPVHDTFSTGMSRIVKIQKLIEYCDKKEQFETLLKLVKQYNRSQYDNF